MPEKFYTVIFVGMVRSGEDDPGIRTKRSGDISNVWRRQRTDNENIDSEVSNSGNERVLEHVTRKPRVFPEHNFGARARRVLARIKLRENVSGGAAELQGSFGRDGFDVRHPANAVRSEDFFFLGHDLIERLDVRFAKGKLCWISDFRC